MSDRESTLRDMGVSIYEPLPEMGLNPTNSLDNSFANFSGYGEFTPITVKSGTEIIDANVERDQRGDQ